MDRCPNCPERTPLVMTFERPGAEFHCLGCGRWSALLANTFDRFPSDEDARLHQLLVDMFRAGARGPIAIPAPPPPPQPAADTIRCDGCGKDSGRTLQQGKPAAWYQREDADGVQVACSRGCIGTIASATGKTAVVMPW